MIGVITASEPALDSLVHRAEPAALGKLVTRLPREDADASGRGQPWKLSLEDRVLLVAAYWRTNLTLQQLSLSSG